MPFATKLIFCSRINGTIEILTARLPTDLLIVSGGLVEIIPVRVLFLLVTFAERLTEVEDDSDFLDLIRLSSFTCVPLHVELQSSHCLPNPFSFP